jgi:hypothetical protein
MHACFDCMRALMHACFDCMRAPRLMSQQDLGADELVLPVLQSLIASAAGDETSTVAAAGLLAHMTPSARALPALLAFLQVRLVACRLLCCLFCVLPCSPVEVYFLWLCLLGCTTGRFSACGHTRCRPLMPSLLALLQLQGLPLLPLCSAMLLALLQLQGLMFFSLLPLLPLCSALLNSALCSLQGIHACGVAWCAYRLLTHV